MTGASTPYDDAQAFAEAVLEKEVAEDVGRAILTRRESRLAWALTSVGGNMIALIAGHERAERFHRDRMSYQREKAAKAMPIARRAR